MNLPKTLMLLGSGELGKEVTLSAQRLGLKVIAVDRYHGAPAMHAAQSFEVIDMLDPDQLLNVVRKHQPDFILPEIEAISTSTLLDLEKQGFFVAPSARAVHLTMNRDEIRNFAHDKLKLKTARYAYAESLEELVFVSQNVGFPCVIKPVMSSSGKGQSVCKNKKDLQKCWEFALAGMRGKKKKIIVEEFIHFESEITLLTVRQRSGKTIFVDPIGHRQERGDYQESWMPARVKPDLLKKAQKMAKKVTDALGGYGLFGVEFFLTKNDIYFSELSPRPHDTGLVTLISQNLSEFDLHLRAVLGIPIPKLKTFGPSASAVILGKFEADKFSFQGIEDALKTEGTDLRLFGKPKVYEHRRMGVALATETTVDKARSKAKRVASKIKITRS